MNESLTTICGNVADAPARRRAGDAQVTGFRMAATERKYDGASGQWRDGKTFWVDVDCWNDLGANVASCVSKGDPVIVKGSLSTSAWDSENGRRSKLLITALSVGHDLVRGVSVFKRSARQAPADPPSGDPAGPADFGTAPDPDAVEEVPVDERYVLDEEGRRVDTVTGVVAEPVG